MSDVPLRLIILARDRSPRIHQAHTELREFLEGQSGVEIVAEMDITEDLTLEDIETDLVVVLGGDGAILRACRQMGEQQLPILGVNLGRLGFLADLSPAEFRDCFPRILKRDYSIVEHLMYKCRLIHDDGRSESYLGLNEVAVLSGTSHRMLDVDLSIDGEQVTTYSCDGLILSTPVGSTAHNLAAGGPILRQDMQAFVITPICPHTLTHRPVVDRADGVYQLRVSDEAKVVIDGQIHHRFSEEDIVEVCQAPVTFKLARIPGHSFYGTLHRKLGWAGQTRYRDE